MHKNLAHLISNIFLIEMTIVHLDRLLNLKNETLGLAVNRIIIGSSSFHDALNRA